MKLSQTLLIVSAVVIPLMMFAGTAWERRVEAMHEGSREIVRTLGEINENVRVMLNNEKRALLSVNDHIKNMTWDEIAQPATSTFLRELASVSDDGIEAIWIADPDGYIKASSELFAPDVRVAEQELFASLGTAPSLLGHDHRRHATKGHLHHGRDLSVHAQRCLQWHPPCSLECRLLLAPFQDVRSLRCHAGRRDGEVLVSNAKAPDYYLDPSTPLMRKIAEQPTGHFVATEQTLYSDLPLPGFPLYVSLGMNRTMILRHWRQDVRSMASRLWLLH